MNVHFVGPRIIKITHYCSYFHWSIFIVMIFTVYFHCHFTAIFLRPYSRCHCRSHLSCTNNILNIHFLTFSGAPARRGGRAGLAHLGAEPRSAHAGKGSSLHSLCILTVFIVILTVFTAFSPYSLHSHRIFTAFSPYSPYSLHSHCIHCILSPCRTSTRRRTRSTRSRSATSRRSRL